MLIQDDSGYEGQWVVSVKM